MAETMPLSGREYAALQTLFATVSSLGELLPILEKRAKMVPNLYRDLRLMEAKATTALDAILRTIPADKLRHVATDVQNVQLYIKVQPPGLRKQNPGFSYTPTATLNELLSYVCEHECLLCDKTPTEARKCEVRRMIEGALPHEVEARDGDKCKYSDMVLGIE